MAVSSTPPFVCDQYGIATEASATALLQKSRITGLITPVSYLGWIFSELFARWSR
jgi:hypothetical protein